MTKTDTNFDGAGRHRLAVIACCRATRPFRRAAGPTLALMLAVALFVTLGDGAHADCAQATAADLTVAAGPDLSSDDGVGEPDTEAALSFVEAIAQDGAAVISDRNASDAERRTTLRATYDTAFATQDIARLAMGRYWRDASDAERAAFSGALGDYFADSLVRYLPSGEFEVMSAEQAAAGAGAAPVDQRPPGPLGLIYMFVHTVFVAENVSSPVMWSITEVDCQLKIVDVTVNGRSLVLAQRGNIETSLRRNHGSVDALISDMRHFDPFEDADGVGPDVY